MSKSKNDRKRFLSFEDEELKHRKQPRHARNQPGIGMKSIYTIEEDNDLVDYFKLSPRLRKLI